MYNEEQITTIKATIVRKLINGKSHNHIIKKGKKPNAKVKMPGRTTIYKWLNPNHEDYDATFLNEYNKITISAKHQQSKHCKSNPKGSRASSYNDYRILNARKSNKKRFPNGNIYILKIPILNYYKIGVSKRADIRIKNIEASIPFHIEVVLNEPKKNTYDLEEIIHERYKQNYIKSEWFKLTNKDIDKIIKTISQWERIDNTVLTK